MNTPDRPSLLQIRFARLMVELEGASDEVVDERLTAFSFELLKEIKTTLNRSIDSDIFSEMLSHLDTLNTIDPQSYQFTLWVHTNDMNLPIAGPGDKMMATLEHTFPESEGDGTGHA